VLGSFWLGSLSIPLLEGFAGALVAPILGSALLFLIAAMLGDTISGS
jgi:hypothetical protein